MLGFKSNLGSVVRSTFYRSQHCKLSSSATISLSRNRNLHQTGSENSKVEIVSESFSNQDSLPLEKVLENALIPNESRFQTKPALKPMQFFNSFAPYSDFGYPPPPFTVLNSKTLLSIKDPLLIYHKVYLASHLPKVGSSVDNSANNTNNNTTKNADPSKKLDYDYKTYQFPSSYDYESPYYYETLPGQLMFTKDFTPTFHDPFGNLGKVDFEEPLYVDVTKLDRGVGTRIMQLYGNSLTMDERLQLSLEMTSMYRRKKITSLVALFLISGLLYYYAFTHTEYQAFDDIPMPPMPEPPTPLATSKN